MPHAHGGAKYDAFGRRATVDPLFSALFGYNAADQLVSLTGSDGVDLTFTWDGSLLRRSIWSGLVAGTVEKRYDHLLRLKEQVTMGQSVQTAYDADDLPIQVGPVVLGRDPANGRAVSATVGGVTETFGYNAFGELETQEAKHGGASLLRRDYARDALGRITGVTESALGAAPTSRPSGGHAAWLAGGDTTQDLADRAPSWVSRQVGTVCRCRAVAGLSTSPSSCEFDSVSQYSSCWCGARDSRST